eukprot:gnl/MRDRNA2_/MRDRNA2_33856_c0_seq1.p1 gnl/MRDRNA2_/MRDRNA2_33856_c0~~gnl/MRDRNA2_/MRDRNA2_33856_c0_seq1.p1  ORF type:complete len:388 (+),score=42.59 gnl/MRDRNA2_/MRDRNA2_33856_c0_seq1:159-1322(+)
MHGITIIFIRIFMLQACSSSVLVNGTKKLLSRASNDLFSCGALLDGTCLRKPGYLASSRCPRPTHFTRSSSQILSGNSFNSPPNALIRNFRHNRLSISPHSLPASNFEVAAGAVSDQVARVFTTASLFATGGALFLGTLVAIAVADLGGWFQPKWLQALPGIKAAGVLLWANSKQVVVGWDASLFGWSDFGGKRNFGESVKACAARELREETGLDPDDLDIDWKNLYVLTDCKYAFFQGKLGNKVPQASRAISRFKKVHITAVPSSRSSEDARVGYSYRLQRVAARVRQMQASQRQIDQNQKFQLLLPVQGRTIAGQDSRGQERRQRVTQYGRGPGRPVKDNRLRLGRVQQSKASPVASVNKRRNQWVFLGSGKPQEKGKGRGKSAR